jgi:hypothetical protein
VLKKLSVVNSLIFFPYSTSLVTVHEFDCAIIGIENANNHANKQANLCFMDHLRAKTIARGLYSFSRGHSQPIILRAGLLSQTSRPYLPEGRVVRQ